MAAPLTLSVIREIAPDEGAETAQAGELSQWVHEERRPAAVRGRGGPVFRVQHAAGLDDVSPARPQAPARSALPVSAIASRPTGSSAATRSARSTARRPR